MILAAISACVLTIYLIRNQLKKNADILSPVNRITVAARVEYINNSGVSINEVASTDLIKVDPIIFDYSSVNTKLKDFVIDTNDTETLTEFPLSEVEANFSKKQIVFDWTTIRSLDLGKSIDVTIRAPGVLARKVDGLSLSGADLNQNIGSFNAGDINQDDIIDYQDYILFKEKFGKNGISDPADFNGDGIVDLQDFAISFGNNCYGANVNNQDLRCGK